MLFVTPHDAGEATSIIAQVREAERDVGRAEAAPLQVHADLVVVLDDTEDAARERLARLDGIDELRSDAAVLATTPTALADLLLAWRAAGLDGYRLRPAVLPTDLDRIVDGLVPELQRRGAFRTDYAESTLRERFGPARPVRRTSPRGFLGGGLVRTKLTLAAVLATAALTLSACGGGGSGADADADAGPPRPGGNLVFAVSSDQGCADPQQVGSNDSIYSLRQIVDSLTDQDPKTGAIVPWLAASWTSNPTATEWTFTLKPGATFSDGTPVDATAVKANFDRVPSLGARGTLPKGYLAGYQGTTVTSPTQFTVRFAQPNVQFLQGTSTHSLGLLSPASVARTDDQRCAGVIGSGPFVLASYVKNQSTVLTKRPGYSWGSSLFTHPGEAYLDRAEFRVVPESGVRTGSLQSGEVDAITSIGPQDEQPLAGAGIALPSRANPGIPFGITFNLSTPIAQDAAVRDAVSLGINRQELVSAVFTSQTKPATSPLASTTPTYADQSALLGFDPAKANTELDADGWVRGPDGIRSKGGTRLTLPLIFAQNLATVKPAVELLQQQLRAVGIDLALQEKQIADVATITQGGQFTAIWGNLTRADPDILRAQYWSGGANLYRFPPGPLDALLVGQAAALDPGRRAQLSAQAQQLIASQHLVVPIVELTTTLGVGPNAHAVAFDASARIQLHDTWKSQ
ncbi:MAG: peptide/nickel transport system substrate-binding protein [Actinomycetota bacterium]|nr:peptide/nickel transport system substrate-binding protein [Actinomycetota bacterium]